ncbi:MAG: DUF4831 family protein [Bacteroidota bacterium]|nr:DUF4831 family protein [Bacteroidota bacterium]
MKRRILLLISVLLLQSAMAQIKVVPAKNSGTTAGLYYALPQTVFKVRVVVEHNQTIPGPFSDYAQEYLGITNAPMLRNDEYRIIDVQMESFSRPDPDQIYFVQYAERSNKDEKSFLVSLSESGLITGTGNAQKTASAGKIELQQDVDANNYEPAFSRITSDNLYEHIDTVVRRINIDTLSIEKNFYRSSWQQKSTGQKARDAADFISRIKENRFLLMSGYQEVNYGESIKYMDEQLQKLYNEYLSLFIGAEQKSIYHYSFLYTPEATQNEQSGTLFKFSVEGGIFDKDAPAGQNVNIRINPSGVAASIGDMGRLRANPNAESNGYYYRIPEYADVSIEYNKRKLYNANLQVNQLGAVSVTPFYHPEIEFHPNTGGVKSLKIK